MNSYEGLPEKNVYIIIATYQQLLKVYFSNPKILDYLNFKLGQVADVNQTTN